MRENAIVLLFIAVALVAANVPFLLRHPLLMLHCPQSDARVRRWYGGLALLVWTGLAAVAWLAQTWIGQTVASGGAQSWFFLLRVVTFIGVVVVLLAIPAWCLKQARVLQKPPKPFWQCLLEWGVLYGLVGALGIAFEANLGSVFVQGWQFYAVTASLFLVMAYPGFVIRYLYKPKRNFQR